MLTTAISNALYVVDYLSSRLGEVPFFIDAEMDATLWECVALLRSLGGDFAIARGLIHAGAASADRFAGAAMDVGVFGRGLLYDSIDLSILLGTVQSEGEVVGCYELLNATNIAPVPIIVAYLDYLGVTDGKTSTVAETFARIGRMLAARTGRHCYYWTASDTYCLSVTLGAGNVDAQIANFLLELVEIQANVSLPGDVGWMWQIGATVGSATLVGDMVLPSTHTNRAANLMKRAKLPGKGGGLILCDKDVCTPSVFDRLRDAPAVQSGAIAMTLTGRTHDLLGINIHELSIGIGSAKRPAIAVDSANVVAGPSSMPIESGGGSVIIQVPTALVDRVEGGGGPAAT